MLYVDQGTIPVNLKQPIYTKLNWQLITHLWPNGTLSRNSYTVWLDVDSNEYHSKLERLRKHSEYLAYIVHSYSECGVIQFTREF